MSHQCVLEFLEVVVVLAQKRPESLANCPCQQEENHVLIGAHQVRRRRAKPLAHRAKRVSTSFFLNRYEEVGRDEKVDELHAVRCGVAAHGDNGDLAKVIRTWSSHAFDEGVASQRSQPDGVFEVHRAISRLNALHVDPRAAESRQEPGCFGESCALTRLDAVGCPPINLNAGGARGRVVFQTCRVFSHACKSSRLQAQVLERSSRSPRRYARSTRRCVSSSSTLGSLSQRRRNRASGVGVRESAGPRC